VIDEHTRVFFPRSWRSQPKSGRIGGLVGNLPIATIPPAAPANHTRRSTRRARRRKRSTRAIPGSRQRAATQTITIRYSVLQTFRSSGLEE